jgi:hypothetical protein
MTLSASFFSYLTAAWCDVDIVFEATSGEVVRVPESVACFSGVFTDEPRRRVTVVAYSDGSMAGFQPAGILLSHHVTIDASFSIIRHV